MKKIIYSIVFFVLITMCHADFDKGVQFYNNGEYEKAILEFEKSDVFTDVVYYNIGNSYYRLGDKSKALKYYLSVFLKNPGFKSNLNNIRLIDNTFNPLISYLFPFNIDLLFIMINLSLSLFIILWFFKEKIIQKKKLMFYVGNIIVVTLIIYLSIVYTIYSGIDMVISSKDIKGYSSPDDKSADIAQFAQNTILFIESTGANYIKVRDSGGISGWVSKDNIIEITTVQEKFLIKNNKISEP